jgi:chloramphenicol 3-O phosphotransferase
LNERLEPKSSVARSLQSLLPGPWLTLGVDTLIEAMPASFWGSSQSVALSPSGRVVSGPTFRTLQAAWSDGVAAMARGGAAIILDEVFLSGAAAQKRWATVLDGLPVLWVGLRCDPDVAAAREATRDDRVRGMAASQATLVHRGVIYDIEIDTARTSPRDCAQIIVDRIGLNAG